MLHYIMFALLIFLAIATTLFACVRWIFVKNNWSSVDATIEGTHFVRNLEDTVFFVDITYVFDDMLYRGSITAPSLDQSDYVAGSPMAVLVNPKRPTRFNRHRDYGFQTTRIAKWLERKLVTSRGNT